MRDPQRYLDDLRTAANKIARYTRDQSEQEFIANDIAKDAVLRNLEIIGEAAKKLPVDVRQKFPAIEWRRIAGFRDIIAHAYFNVDDAILADIVFNKIPLLRKALGEAE